MSRTQKYCRAKRRQFSAEYKLRILAEADECTRRGSIGALLRREGLYSSHLDKWRKQRDRRALVGLGGQKRGRKRDPQAAEIAQLRAENDDSSPPRAGGTNHQRTKKVGRAAWDDVRQDPKQRDIIMTAVEELSKVPA